MLNPCRKAISAGSPAAVSAFGYGAGGFGLDRRGNVGVLPAGELLVVDSGDLVALRLQQLDNVAVNGVGETITQG